METQDGWLVRGKQTLRSICPQPILNWREAQFYARFGEVELHLLEFLCRRGEDSIDVGANDGAYVHFLRRYSKRVVAYEPLPWLARALEQKFGEDVVIINLALSASAGTARLRVPVVNGVRVSGCSSLSDEAPHIYGQTDEIEVAMDALDNVYFGKVGFIKIDVEGYEESVLAGAQNTIRKNRPRMLVESDERMAPGGLERIWRYFHDLEYRGFFIDKGKVKPVEAFDPAIYQQRHNLPDLTAPLQKRERFGSYIYNFMFFPSTEVETVLKPIQERLNHL